VDEVAAGVMQEADAEPTALPQAVIGAVIGRSTRPPEVAPAGVAETAQVAELEPKRPTLFPQAVTGAVIGASARPVLSAVPVPVPPVVPVPVVPPVVVPLVPAGAQLAALVLPSRLTPLPHTVTGAVIGALTVESAGAVLPDCWPVVVPPVEPVGSVLAVAVRPPMLMALPVTETGAVIGASATERPVVFDGSVGAVPVEQPLFAEPPSTFTELPQAVTGAVTGALARAPWGAGADAAGAVAGAVVDPDWVPVVLPPSTLTAFPPTVTGSFTGAETAVRCGRVELPELVLPLEEPVPPDVVLGEPEAAVVEPCPRTDTELPLTVTGTEIGA
jgi:hypothetical protein